MSPTETSQQSEPMTMTRRKPLEKDSDKLRASFRPSPPSPCGRLTQVFCRHGSTSLRASSGVNRNSTFGRLDRLLINSPARRWYAAQAASAPIATARRVLTRPGRGAFTKMTRCSVFIACQKPNIAGSPAASADFGWMQQSARARLASTEMNPFEQKLAQHQLTLERTRFETLQLTIGRKSNQACQLC